MDIETFNTATELYNRYKLCESVLENITDKDTSIGPKFKELLVQFVKEYEGDFLMFVHTKMTEAGEAFEDLHCCPAEKSEDTMPPADAKFQIGDRVKIVNSIIPIFNGRVATVEAYDSTINKFGVRPDGFSEQANLQWYAEDEIEPYAESEEKPEEPTEPDVPLLPEDAKFQYGDRVVADGNVGTIVGYDFIEHKYGVIFDSGDEEPQLYAESELEPYTESEENPDEPEAEQP